MMQVALLLESTRSGAPMRWISWGILASGAVAWVVAMVEGLAGWWTRRAQKRLEMFCASWALMTPLLDNYGRHRIMANIVVGYRRA